MQSKRFFQYLILAGLPVVTALLFCSEPVSPYLEPYKIELPESSPFYAGAEIQDKIEVLGEGLDSVTVSPALPDSLLLDKQTGALSGIPWESVDGRYTVSAYNEHGSMSAEWHLVVLDTNTYLDTTVSPAAGGTIAVTPEPDFYHPTKAWYARGTTVSVTATPAPGYTFTTWTGSKVSAGKTLSITLDSTMGLSAVFAEAEGYTITSAVEPGDAGSIALNPDEDSYEEGEEVTVTAVPNQGYSFVRWEGALEGDNATEKIVMDSNLSISAVFSQDGEYSITTSVEPQDAGSITLSPEQSSYEEGAQVAVVAAGNPGFVFIGWEGDISGTEPSRSLVIDSSLTIKAVFARSTYTLLVNKTGAGTVLMGQENPTQAPAEIQVEAGQSIHLSAEPADGYVFNGWTGVVTGKTNPVTVTVSRDSAKITASFTEIGKRTISGSVAPEGAGTVSASPSKDSYDLNETVQLKAEPAEGFRFVRWSGDVSGPFDSVSVTMDESKLYTAEFEPIPHTITVDIEGDGSVLPVSPIDAVYGETVSLSATPAGGHRFDAWSGDVQGSDSSVSVLVDGDKNVTALFVPIDTFTITTTANPSVGGTFTLNPQKSTYTYGEEVLVEAMPAEGYQFDSWSGASTSTLKSIRLTIDGNAQLVGAFSKKTYTVAVEKEGNGSVTPEENSIVVQYNDEVTLSAEAAEGYNFIGWAGDLDGTGDNPVTFSVTRSMNVKAVFVEKDKYAVVTSVSPKDAGSVTRDPDKNSYERLEEVAFTASPAPGYEFVEWRSEDSTITAESFTLTVDTSYSFTAVFRAKKYSITVNSGEGGSVTRSPEGKIPHGEKVSFTAVPSTGYRFVSWGNDASGSQNPTEVVVDGPKTVSASFAKIDTFKIKTTVTPSGKGTVNLDPGGPTYEYLQDVTLTTTPNTGYRFKNWGGDVSSAGSNSTAILTVRESHKVSATFEKIPYSIKVQIDGSGTVEPSVGTHTHYYGDQVDFSVEPAAGYNFDGWSGDFQGTATDTTVTVVGDITVEAVFSKKNSYKITPSVTPTNSGVVRKSPDRSTYTYEEEVTLTADPAEGYRFVRWENGLGGSNPTKTVTVTSSLQPRAVFEKKTYTLTVNKTGTGTVSPSGDVTIEHGESVNIVANPGSDYLFDDWSVVSGNASIVNNESRNTTVSLNEDATIRANFTLKPLTSDPVISPSGGVYQNEVTVSISCETNGATIHYTTNNTTPTTSSPEYTGSFKLTADAVVRAVAVANAHRISSEASVTYTVNQPPSVSITSPKSGDVVAGSVSFQVDPSDPDGVVDKVEFERLGSVLGTATAASGWIWSWDGAPVGTNTITATAYDNNGGSASASVTFSYAQWQKLAKVPASAGSKHISLAMPGTGNPYITTIRTFDDGGSPGMDRKLFHYSGGSWRTWDKSPQTVQDSVLFYPISVSNSGYLFGAYPDLTSVMVDYLSISLQRYDPASDTWENGGDLWTDEQAYEPYVGIGTLSGTDQAIAAHSDEDEYGSTLYLHRYGPSGWEEMPQSEAIDVNRGDKMWISGFPDDAYLLLETGECFNLTSNEALELDVDLSGGKGLAVSGENVFALTNFNHVYRIAPGSPIRIKESGVVFDPDDASIAGDETGLYYGAIESGSAVMKKYDDGNWVNFPTGSNGVVSSQAGLEEIEISVKDGKIAVAVVCADGVFVYKLLK